MPSRRLPDPLLALSLLLLAACDDTATTSSACDVFARDLEQAAGCIVARINEQPSPPVDCDGQVAKFQAAGLTSHDAIKIVGSDVKSFYSTYYNKSFCDYMFPRWLSRRFD